MNENIDEYMRSAESYAFLQFEPINRLREVCLFNLYCSIIIFWGYFIVGFILLLLLEEDIVDKDNVIVTRSLIKHKNANRIKI